MRLPRQRGGGHRSGESNAFATDSQKALVKNLDSLIKPKASMTLLLKTRRQKIRTSMSRKGEDSHTPKTGEDRESDAVASDDTFWGIRN